MDTRIKKCPYCGGTEFGEGYQSFQARMQSKNNVFKNSQIFHVICLDCGSIVRSYVEKPDKFR